MKKRLSYLALLSLIVLFACRKNSGVNDVPDPVDVPNLTGGVLLFNEADEMIKADDIIVSVENVVPAISTKTVLTTGLVGSFGLSIPPSLDSFALVFASPRMGTYKRYMYRNGAGEFYYRNVDHSINQTSDIGESLGLKSSVTVNSFEVSLINDSTLQLTCDISSPNPDGDKYIRILTQKDRPDISIGTIDQNDWKTYAYRHAVKNGLNTFTWCLKCSAQCQDWKKGDQIYLTAYGDALYPNMYVDQSTGKLMFPNLNPDNNNVVTSFTMPF